MSAAPQMVLCPTCRTPLSPEQRQRLRCSCPVGFGATADPGCARHGPGALHTITGPAHILGTQTDDQPGACPDWAHARALADAHELADALDRFFADLPFTAPEAIGMRVGQLHQRTQYALSALGYPKKRTPWAADRVGDVGPAPTVDCGDWQAGF